jgi:hypothetical protein
MAQPSCPVHKYPAGLKVITGTQIHGVFVLKKLKHLCGKTEFLGT